MCSSVCLAALVNPIWARLLRTAAAVSFWMGVHALHLYSVLERHTYSGSTAVKESSAQSPYPRLAGYFDLWPIDRLRIAQCAYNSSLLFSQVHLARVARHCFRDIPRFFALSLILTIFSLNITVDFFFLLQQCLPLSLFNYGTSPRAVQ